MADGPSDQDDIGPVEMEEEAVDDSACVVFNDGQLSYIGHDVESIPQPLIDDYSKQTRRLDLSYNRLRSLSGIQDFCNLEELVLDNNEITDSVQLPTLNHLHTLTLNKNKLTDLDRLLDDMKVKLPKLTYLSLLGNIACPNQLSSHEKDDEDYQRYRNYVLYRLPELKFLDSSPVLPSELAEAKRVGPFMTVVRGADMSETSEETTSSSPPTLYSPLPDNQRNEGDHQGTFSRSKYVYYGRHSEGNRFIRNTDL